MPIVRDLKNKIDFIGEETFTKLVWSIFLGVFEFFVESSFVFVLQGLLFAFGIMDHSKVSLPEWYPLSVKACLIIFIIFGIFRSLTAMLKMYTSSISNQLFVQYNRSRMFEYGIVSRDQLNSSKLMSMFTDTITRGGWGIYYASQVLIKSVVSVFLFCAGLWIAPVEMSVGLIMLLVLYYPQRFLNKKVASVGKGLVDEWTITARIFTEGMRNNFFLRAHGLVGKIVTEGKKSIQNYCQHQKDNYLISSLKVGAPNLLGTIVVTIIIYISLNHVGTKGAVLLSFLYIFIRFVQNVGESIVALNDFKVTIPVFKELYGFYNEYVSAKKTLAYDELSAEEEIDSKKIETTQIELKNISFSYGKENTIFQDLNLSIKKGTPLIIKGKSGTGKSTLVSLILGLIRPESGQVLINDNENFSNKNFYKSVSYVGPMPFLIPGTIKENLLYGNGFNVASDDILIEALIKASIWKELQDKGLGIDSVLNEEAQLSTGQKQRISIARALLRRPEVYIFDEATANIDSLLEKSIFENIQWELNNKIFIFISHRRLELNLETKILELT